MRIGGLVPCSRAAAPFEYPPLICIPARTFPRRVAAPHCPKRRHTPVDMHRSTFISMDCVRNGYSPLEFSNPHTNGLHSTFRNSSTLLNALEGANSDNHDLFQCPGHVRSRKAHPTFNHFPFFLFLLRHLFYIYIYVRSSQDKIPLLFWS